MVVDDEVIDEEIIALDEIAFEFEGRVLRCGTINGGGIRTRSKSAVDVIPLTPKDGLVADGSCGTTGDKKRTFPAGSVLTLKGGEVYLSLIKK